jgi:hypothetical protein
MSRSTSVSTTNDRNGANLTGASSRHSERLVESETRLEKARFVAESNSVEVAFVPKNLSERDHLSA